MTKYKITVKTADKDDAGTNANVFITLYGQNGDCGQRKLDGKFERGMKEDFEIENMDLGDLHCINIRHDNSGKKPGWFLEDIMISDKWYFPCNRWLAKDGDDHLISRGLAENRFYRTDSFSSIP